MNYADETKAALTAREVFEHYGFMPNRAGFVCCPFHGENEPSLKVYNDGRGWCCFGCHKGGDIIKFVREFFGLSFKDALAKLNDDFHLGLPIGEKRTLRQRMMEAKASHERKLRTEQQKAERDRLNAEYWAAFDRWKRYDDALKDYAPRKPDDDFSPLFMEALQNIDSAARELDAADDRRKQHERANNAASA